MSDVDTAAVHWLTRYDTCTCSIGADHDGSAEQPGEAHGSGCESEFIVEAGAWTPCRCHPSGGAR